MALTLRTNGSSGVNLVTASWWNDYYNLLTGSMNDQTVTLKTTSVLQAIGGPPGAPTLATAAGTTLGIGVYQYVVTFANGWGGQTTQGTSASISTTTNNQSVSLTAIPTGPTGTASRKLYRTKVGGSTYFLLATLGDNTTTTYTDTTADTSLGASTPPATPNFGGNFVIEDYNTNIVGQIFSNGSIWFNGGKLQTDTNGVLTFGSYDGAIATVRTIRVFIGTTDPSTYLTPNTGDIWVKV